MTEVSFNFHGQGIKNEPRMIKYFTDAQPAWALCMDALGTADKMHNASPNTNLIYRKYVPDGAWYNHDPVDFLEFMQHELAGRPYWAYVDNEVGLNPPWYTKLIQRNKLYKQPLNIVLPNISTGTPEFVEWKKQDVKDLLFLMADNRDNIVFGGHSYGHVLLNSGFQDQHFVVAKKDWIKTIDPKKNNFHIGREKALFDLYPNLALRMVLTEFGWDTLTDMMWWLITSYGWRNCVQWWKQMYGNDVDINQLMFDQIVHAITYQLDKRVEAVMLYCYGHVDPKWFSFDFEGTGLVDLIEAYRPVTPPAQPPPPPPVITDRLPEFLVKLKELINGYSTND